MSDSDPAQYKTNLTTRFTEPKTVAEGTQLSEKAVDYVYRAIDRQINKARGVLAYNGLLFASFNLASRNTSDKFVTTVANLGAVAALLSCFVLLYLMIFELGDAHNYASTENDFNATFDSMWRRKTILEYSLGLSFVATFAAILLPLRFLNSVFG
jgi:hypothetical protein